MWLYIPNSTPSASAPGGGGLDLALELAIAGARSVCMVEREAFAVAHLVAAMRSGRLAPCPVWSDARTFNGRPWRGLVDGVIGGIPCQPHSLAGRKRGSLDARDLWSTARRIIVQSRARFVLIENVGGMLAAGADEIAGAERVWRDLRKLGFAVEGGLFTAAEVGARHQRERLFILGIHDGPGGVELANPNRSGLAIGRSQRGDDGSQLPAVERGGGAMADTNSQHDHRRGSQGAQRRVEPANRSNSMADADGGHGGLSQEQHLADAHGDEQAPFGRNARKSAGIPESEGGAEHGTALSRGFGLPNFPPGPGDIDGWRDILARAPQLEPAVRRMVDGLAAGMDASGAARVDLLRMLGNGVVPLEGAYAIRTLLARLAARGSAGAAELLGGVR